MAHVPISRRHVLLVGGAGYVGSVLARRLLAVGARVRVLDALYYGNGAAVAELVPQESFSFLRGDFCDTSTLTTALEGVTDVVHLAALVGDPICKKYPDEARRINQHGTIRLLEALGDRPVETFVFLSTCSNYGLRGTESLAGEASELNPQSLYAETKVAVERHILEHRDGMPFAPVILRLSTAYGISPRMRFDLTVSEFTRELALGRELLVYDESTWRPYCHVQDIGSAVIQVLEAGRRAAGEVFNVGSSEENHTKKSIVDLASAAVGDARVRYQQKGSDPRNYRVSFEKIRRELGFETRHSVEQSIPRLVGAIRNGLFDDVEPRRDFYGNHAIHGF